jgi:hypothetical protein
LKAITTSATTIADTISGHDVTTQSGDIRLILTVSSCPSLSAP